MHSPGEEVRVNLVKMIEVVFLRGAGTDEDPVREVRAYFSTDATNLCMAEHDPLHPSPGMIPRPGGRI